MQKILGLGLLIAVILISAYSLGFFKQQIIQGNVLSIEKEIIPEVYVEGTAFSFQILSLRTNIIDSTKQYWIEARELNSNMIIPTSPSSPFKFNAIPSGGLYGWTIAIGYTNTILPPGIPDVKMKYSIGHFDTIGNKVTDIERIFTIPIAKRIIRIENVEQPSKVFTNYPYNLKLIIKNTDSTNHKFIIREEFNSTPIKSGILAIGEEKEITLTFIHRLTGGEIGKTYLDTRRLILSNTDNQEIIEDKKVVGVITIIAPSPPSPPSPRGWAFILGLIGEWLKDIFKV